MQGNGRTLFDFQDWVKLQLNIDSYEGSSNNLLAFLHRQIHVLFPTLQSYIPPCPSLASQTLTQEERVWGQDLCSTQPLWLGAVSGS